jgi:hypothetical protein
MIKKLHPKQIAYREAMRQPVVGTKRKHSMAGCYGVCCGEGTKGSRLCTVCRKQGQRLTCCGYKTVYVSARVRLPRLNASNRWREFLKRFPRFRFRESLKAVA